MSFFDWYIGSGGANVPDIAGITQGLVWHHELIDYISASQTSL